MYKNVTRILLQSLTALKRDWHSGELRLIAFAIVIAVASLTSVSFFTDRVRQATERQATELLAADLVLRSSRPIEPSIFNQATAGGLFATRTISFRSVVVVNEKLQMAEVKAVESGYPVRGKLRTVDSLFGKEAATDELPERGTVWVDARLLQILGVEIGQTVNLGAMQFIVKRILSYEPDRGGDIFNIAPRLLMNLDDVPATKLILPGSRVQYRLLLGGDIGSVRQFRNQIEKQDNKNLQVQGIRDARPELKTALERAEQFLGLAALVSIALAGLAVAMSAQRYATRHFDNCAIMRCLGAEQRTITQLYFTQLLILSVCSGLLGTILGYIAQEGLTILASGLTKGYLPAPSMAPIITGIAAAIVTALGFAMPQILRLRNVTPLRVLRRDLTPVPVSGILAYGIAVSALALLTPWQSGKFTLTLYACAGIILTTLLLVLGSRLLIRYLNRFRSRVGVAFRYGLANIARRANLSTAQILGIGLGVMVMLLLTLIRTDLLEKWRDRLPDGTPNYFLINIQPDEVEALNTFLKQNAALSTTIYPMIRGRITAINNNPVDPDAYADQRARRLAAREFNLSWAVSMQADNRLAQGKWWREDEKDALFSVEEGIAESLGINMGDTLSYSVAGKDVTGIVSNIRWVEWDSFNVNFFVIANPGTLDDMPATYITSFYLAPDKRALLIDLIRNFPSVTVFDVDALINQVRVIMDQVIHTVEFVFGFTLIAGLVVLFAALQTTNDERTYESALLIALGANRHQILAGLTAEFLCIGLIGGILSAFAATIVEMILAEFVFQMEIVINPWVWLIAPLVCTIVIVAGGLAGTRKVLHTPPVVALRQY